MGSVGAHALAARRPMAMAAAGSLSLLQRTRTAAHMQAQTQVHQVRTQAQTRVHQGLGPRTPSRPGTGPGAGAGHIVDLQCPTKLPLSQRQSSSGALSMRQPAGPAVPSRLHCEAVRPLCTASASASGQTAEAPVAETSPEALSGSAIRQAFLDFYASRGHTVLPSSSLVPEDPTVLLTIAGMLQFKPVFLGQAPRAVPRATTSQKCVRTNDVENVGRTARHHTFFEMLGNFSFGDYFKEEAILWAWELATQVFKIPSSRIFVSVFREDDEAYAIWRDKVGVPEARIKRMDEEDNFWASGATGPCGPCSEMYYDFHPERGLQDTDLGDDSRFIEFYNLVFMESNRLEDGSLQPLKNKNIDTGLGLERLAQILQKVPNNYETDLIFPIIQKAASLAGVDYHSAPESTKQQLKVIGDHTRAVVYLISDGVMPSNIGRGYVVRRLIRRVVRMGRLLGIRGDGQGNAEGAFLPIVAAVAIEMSGDVDPEVRRNAARIQEELAREEVRFVQTLERGERLLEQLLAEAQAGIQAGTSSQAATDGALEGEGGGSSSNGGAVAREGEGAVISGRDAFVLYDTYGFPIEITQEVAEERGVSVDMEGFLAEMERQRQLSQAAHTAVKLAVGGAVADLASQLPPTSFVGYAPLGTPVPATVTAVVRGGTEVVTRAGPGDEVDVILDKTPFYAESGGQIGDWGELRIRTSSGLPSEGGGSTGLTTGLSPGSALGEESQGAVLVRVRDVQKAAGGGLFLHRGVVESGALEVGQEVAAIVDSELRSRAQAHHTATHLLQSALRQVLGPEVSQAGSLVAFDRLRFDFNFARGATDAELERIESLVNGWIAQAVDLESKTMKLAEAKASGAIAMFGEKYGEEVRVIDVPGISRELCGGTHVANTAHIRGFKILSESGIASGVRRIEAVAGAALLDLLDQQDAIVKELSASLKVKPEAVGARVAGLQEELRAARTEVGQLRGELAVAKAQLLVDQSYTLGPQGIKVLVANVEGVDAEALKAAAEGLSAKLGAPYAVVLGSALDGKVSLISSFSPEVVKAGLQAGKFVGELAKLCGGGGGGRPNFAQAGGRQPEKLAQALELAQERLKEKLSS